MKRSRGLLSNAFHATNSKLNRLHISSKRDRGKPSVIGKASSIADVLNYSHLKAVDTARPSSPDMKESFLTNSHTKPQYMSDHVSSSPSQILLPALANMSTFASFYSAANYTSGYERSSSQQDLETKSPTPSNGSGCAMGDRQADSCFESDSSFQQHESPILKRRSEPSHIHNFGPHEHPANEPNMPLKGIKRNKSPDYCWELINLQDPRSPKIAVPLKKRPFSHEQPADPPDSLNSPDSPKPLNLTSQPNPQNPTIYKREHNITENLLK